MTELLVHLSKEMALENKTYSLSPFQVPDWSIVVSFVNTSVFTATLHDDHIVYIQLTVHISCITVWQM